ncbi:MAG: UDP-N-acetylglucosamine 1-carboxyvinyltransferase [Clostridiales bacterium]|nr:UDP-N-acetylglucosamine 1-carboxyvinyltransferase [Clostridiales bacterium]
MECFEIIGGKRLQGEYTLSGAKNGVLPILAAALLPEGESRILDCPGLSDVAAMVQILEALGCRAEREGRVLTLDPQALCCTEIPAELMKRMRSSVFLMGPLLARCGEVTLCCPGGCDIGCRPIDLHLEGLKKLGVEIREEGGLFRCRAARMKGAEIRLPFPSVGATENLMMAALGAEGETLIRGAAREPEIVDLQHFLQKCGARVRGAGTSVIRVKGGRTQMAALRGTEHRVLPDRIEGGTYLAAAAATGGELLLQNACPDHMESFLQVLETMGCRLLRSPDTVYIKAPGRLRPAAVRTGPHPGFPTDLQSPLLTLMCLAEGESQLEETIFEARFRTAEELAKMGAAVTVSEGRARIRGTGRLFGARVQAPDLRGGAALVVAGLAAEGKTIVENICHIDRGYDTLELGMGTLGAEMIRKGQNKKK